MRLKTEVAASALDIGVGLLYVIPLAVGRRYPDVLFDFLGYTFRPRLTAWPNGTYGVAFLPAASQEALKAMRREVRRWGLQNRTDKALDDLARMINPYIRGWINYYSHFYKSALYDSLRRIDFHLRKWVRRGGETPPRHSTFVFSRWFVTEPSGSERQGAP